MDSALRTALVISGYANWQWRLATLTYIPDIGVRAFGVAGQRNDYFRIIVYQSVTLTAVLLRLRRSIIAWLLLQYMAPKLTHVDPLTVAYRR